MDVVCVLGEAEARIQGDIKEFRVFFAANGLAVVCEVEPRELPVRGIEDGVHGLRGINLSPSFGHQAVSIVFSV